MIKSRKSVEIQALKLTMAGIAVSCLGAAVFAAPLTVTPKSKIYDAGGQTVEHRSAYVTPYGPLAKGPALQLGHAAKGEDEDCVKVTRVVGPDGRIYVTRGLICQD
ncbi:hypothetical protein RZS28_00495 [Methylocapsa polymorpha]|uniref:Uncharacterized protein n=1 Tax=Methylocapsa polymorpha TaxID=3080828 RepID=A0ABZ0HTE5_9HYPH|nr:hypothetical protein RZS28_00495 [Methylocapsa sp. RX1]